MRVDLLAALTLALGLAPSPAAACSISPIPSGHFFGSTTGGAPGRRPWISLWNVRDDAVVTINVVAVTPRGARCDPGTVCKGATMAFDRAGKWLRPRADLPPGARVQIITGSTVLGETVIDTATPAPLPAWDGIDFVRIAPKTNAMCGPGGPEIELRIKPTKAKLDNAIGLFYLAKPDTSTPHKDLLMIQMLGAGSDIGLRNEIDRRWLSTSGPKELWMILADDAGNLGAPIKLI